ncbi:MAG TPA: COX15/CtaA family protein [Verrucomicrobiae bacterium]|nr:COX15/CtaA family protein [Verrucomicrobiae bacterium]
MARSRNNPWLHRFAILMAAATLCLVCIGGLVTSHGAGMAVPDWPTTFGYNMFFFPISKWVGGIFYEHTHRLVASAVGFLTIILAAWLWIKEERRWLRWLGVLALAAVIVQGVLGGLRVTWMKDELGIFHATLAQMFFVLVCSIAFFSSRWWREDREPSGDPAELSLLRRISILGTGLILLQLVLGATMRHQHAGLAIPDFPTAYGHIWPATDPASVAQYNQLRAEVTAANPITGFQIVLQMIHRIGAVAVLVVVASVAWFALRRLRQNLLARKLSVGWALLVVCQILLGAATIWTNKSADIATAHVALGALLFANGTLLVLVCSRCLWKNAPVEINLPAGVARRVMRQRTAEATA